jgi:GTP-binding protein
LTPRPEESRVFLDTAIITIASGKGGDGKVSTRREKYVPRGGPDGGNGGRGGSVWLLADAHLTTLLDFRYRRKYEAEEGRQGGANNCTGADGHDIEIKVPCGTVVIDEETGEQIGDLVEAGDRLLLAEGGRGGKGNWEFRNARNQTPMKATPGKPGVERVVRFELKLIADIALVGEPNAGKSTLLSVLTAARPKVADYPFTTLVPNLGIVDLGDYASCTLADIPGLIEGASEGRGLGHEFLRHVERTRALLLLVDPSTAEPAEALAMLRGELESYGGHLARLPFAVVVTKSDVMNDEDAAVALAKARHWATAAGAVDTLQISAVAGRGLTELRHLLRRLNAG